MKPFCALESHAITCAVEFEEGHRSQNNDADRDLHSVTGAGSCAKRAKVYRVFPPTRQQRNTTRLYCCVAVALFFSFPLSLSLSFSQVAVCRTGGVECPRQR